MAFAVGAMGRKFARMGTALGGVPANAILDEAGQPVLDENNQFILAGP